MTYDRAHSAIAEIQLVDDVGLFEKAHGAVDGGDADVRVDGHRPEIDLLDVGMVGGFGEHARDHPPLLGHLEPLLLTKLLQPGREIVRRTGGGRAFRNQHC